MAISASQITTANTLEQLRGEFNNLCVDVTGLEAGTATFTAITATTSTTTTVNVAEDGTIVFEGATADAYETTLTVTDPTADRTITFPNETGTVLTDASSINATTFTVSANNSTNETVYPLFVDGATGSQGAESDTGLSYNPSTELLTVGKLLLDDGATIGVASSTSAITVASTGIVTFVDDILIKDDGTIGSASATTAIAISSAGVVALAATTEASATGTAALTVAGGLGVAKDVWIGDDVVLDSDAVVIKFGDDQEVTLTHVHDTGLLLNTTMALQFYDATQYINAPSATVLDINATDEIELNATLADVNANLDVSGTYQGGGTMTTGGNIVIPDAGTIGSASSTSAITVASTGIITFVDDIVIKDGGTIGTGTTAGAITIAAAGAVTLSSDMVVGALLKMPTVTAGYFLVGDGTSYEEVAVSGDVTMASGGAVTIAANAVEGSMLNTDTISAQTDLASGLATTDELLVSDGGTLKRMDVSVLATLTDGNATALAIALG